MSVYTSRPREWSPKIEVLDRDGRHLYTGAEFVLRSDNIGDTLCGADLVFVTVPSFLFKRTAEIIEPFIKPGMIVCVVPGNGGAELYFQNIMRKGGVLCAFERAHATARIEEYGKAVRQLSLKNQIRVAVMPNRYITAKELADVMGRLFEAECDPLPNMLCASLTPSNPILHTSRIYRLFRDYDGHGYDEGKWMYDTWDDETSAILFQCDEELQKICKALNRMDLRTVLSLKEYYESRTVTEFTAKMKSIQAFRGAKAPMVLREDGWHPDFDSRLFLADIEYGLRFMQQVGQCCQVRTDCMDRILNWYERVTKRKKTRMIPWNNKDQLYSFYLGDS